MERWRVAPLEGRAVSVGVLLAVVVGGCSEPPETPHRGGTPSTSLPDNLPRWTAGVHASFGAGADVLPGLVEPWPLGVDTLGNVYVVDTGTSEIHRFTSSGEYLDRFAGQGMGPGEMRSRPFTFGELPGGVWYTEFVDGVVHYVDFETGEAEARPSGWPPKRLGAVRSEVTPVDGWLSERVLIQANYEEPFREGGLLPWVRTVVLVAHGVRLDTIATYPFRSSSVRLDGGRTTASFPAPQSTPMVVVGSNGDRVFLLEREVPAEGSVAPLRVQTLDLAGRVLRSSEVQLRAEELSPTHLQRFDSVLAWNASLGGRRRLSDELRSTLEGLVDQIPSRLPAFDYVASGESNSLWIRRTIPGGSAPEGHRWIVLDSTLSPVATVGSPGGIQNLRRLSDGRWYGTMENVTGRFVVRLDVAR